MEYYLSSVISNKIKQFKINNIDYQKTLNYLFLINPLKGIIDK